MKKFRTYGRRTYSLGKRGLEHENVLGCSLVVLHQLHEALIVDLLLLYALRVIQALTILVE